MLKEGCRNVTLFVFLRILTYKPKHKTMSNIDLFSTPISSGKIRKNVSWYKYGNGTININGSKFIDYPIKEAVKKWRANNPL